MPLIMLDAGHTKNTFEQGGGKGVRKGGRNYEEHNFNINVAKHTKRYLEASGLDARITKQSFASSENLNNRTDEANRIGADLLVSIHANAGASAAKGACVFHWPTSPKFANMWVDKWKAENTGVGLHGNGKHEVRLGTWTNLHMVREAAMPAYLIEHGFMTNDHDFDYIFGGKSAEYRRDCARAIAKAVCDYFNVKFVDYEDNVPKKQSNPKPSNKDVYTVRKGDTLWEIAKDHKMSVRRLKRLNNLKGNIIHPGDKLRVAGKAKPKKKRAPRLPKGILKRGDRGNKVRRLQKALCEVYFYPNKGAKNNGVDGIFGRNTEDAVRRFQSVYTPHMIDGIYGKRTRRALKKKL
ncbi:N-acetylmuramoyl-L-alanine amidase [Virgibacillus siamensis]|uniref:N-acetylmuramoyl-L-alanine amidase n=1 Tax=Virgibacillus siamensis TaxID=480071 RepID=UPI0009871798|nr:N-acetylmuramoyl-L-alanine amidase [Virgibacillus siamensis]